MVLTAWRPRASPVTGPAATSSSRGTTALSYQALAVMMTLVANNIGRARGSLAMEAVQRAAGAGSATPVAGTYLAALIDNEVKP